MSIPEFWTDRPRAWFKHLEAECDIRIPPIVKMDSKFHLASKALPLSVRAQVSELLDDPPADPYTPLKEALLELYCKTPLDDAYDLLDVTELGDQLPTAHYRAMWKLWNKDGLAVFKALYLRSLPKDLRTALADDDQDMPALAKRADKIVKNNRACSKAEGRAAAISSLEPAAATSAIEIKKKNFSKDASGVCYAHRKYGKEAFSCRGPPCPMVGMTVPKPAPAGKENAGR
jgi:hypothetical protein